MQDGNTLNHGAHIPSQGHSQPGTLTTMNLATKHNKKYLAPLAALGLVCSMPTLADSRLDEQYLQDLYGSEETFSLATGYEQPISAAPATATVTSTSILSISAIKVTSC